MDLASVGEEILARDRIKEASVDEQADEVSAYMQMGQDLSMAFFTKTANPAALQAGKGATTLLRRMVRPAAGAAVVGTAGGGGYALGHGSGEEEGRRAEKMRQLMKDLFGIDISEEQ